MSRFDYMSDEKLNLVLKEIGKLGVEDSSVWAFDSSGELFFVPIYATLAELQGWRQSEYIQENKIDRLRDELRLRNDEVDFLRNEIRRLSISIGNLEHEQLRGYSKISLPEFRAWDGIPIVRVSDVGHGFREWLNGQTCPLVDDDDDPQDWAYVWDYERFKQSERIID